MAEQPRTSVLAAAREADWLPRPNKDIDYPLEGEATRYRPARYEARLRHALDNVVKLWGQCYFCDRVQPIDPGRVPSRYEPSSLLRDLERHLRCIGCGARAEEGADLELLYRGSWETPISERLGNPKVWLPRERRLKLFGRSRSPR